MNDTNLVGSSPVSSANQNKASTVSVWSTIKEIVVFIVIATIIFVPIRMFVVEPYIVDGTSMDPTFATGDYLMVDRLSYRFHQPRRFDVVVTRNPLNPKIYLIKRIIGLPGERLMISKGMVSVMTPPGVEDSVASSTTENVDRGGGGGGQLLSEPYVAIQHVSHEDFDINLSPTQYFVMGDNRADSADSRLWGPLESKYVIGRPILRLLPVSKIGSTPGSVDDFDQSEKK